MCVSPATELPSLEEKVCPVFTLLFPLFFLSCAFKQFVECHLCDVRKGTCAVTVYPKLEATRCSESHLMGALFVPVLPGNFRNIIRHVVLL